MSKSKITYIAVSESGFFYYPSVRSQITILDQLAEFRINEDYSIIEEWMEDNEPKSEIIVVCDKNDNVLRKVRDPIKVTVDSVTFSVTFSDQSKETIGYNAFKRRFNTEPKDWKWTPIEDEFDNLYSSDFYNKWRIIKIERIGTAKTRRSTTRKELILPTLPQNPTANDKKNYLRRMRNYDKKLNRLKAEELL